MFKIKIYSLIFALMVSLTALAQSSDDTQDKVKVLGDLIIESGEVLTGNVVVMQGDLIVKGTIKGNAVVSFGDAVVDSGGVIEGDMVALRGKITVDEYGVVNGEVVESRLFDVSMDNFDSQFDSHFELNINTDKDKSDECFECEDNQPSIDGKVAYNKVDGFFLGITFPKKLNPKFVPNVSLNGFVGYGFSNDRWQYHAELDKWFGDFYRLEFGVEAHELTGTDDSWIIGDHENSLAAFFIHEDFRDYYYRQGSGAHIGLDIGHNFKFQAKYLADEYDSTSNNTNWALFGGDKDFKPNFGFIAPGANITPGMMRSVIASGDARFFNGNLIASASAEYGYEDLGGDFDFARYIFETKGWIDISHYDGIAFRLKFGSSDRFLPPQKYFTLGGISTLRGFTHKEFFGSKMALANIEYRLFKNDKPRKIWFLRPFQFALFADAGSVHPDIFKDFDTDMYKSDVGFSIFTDDGDCRLDIARRTDTGEKPWVVTFRIEEAF